MVQNNFLRVLKWMVLIFILGTSYNIGAQNLYSNKTCDCSPERFCLDCGDIKVSYDEKSFSEMMERLNSKNDLAYLQGYIQFQVLIDSLGKACVYTYSGREKSAISKSIIKELNNFNSWIPALQDGKKIDRVSITLKFKIDNNKLTAEIVRWDAVELKKTIDKPTSPKVDNIGYNYENKSLPNYEFKILNTKNSNLPNNFCQDVEVDHSNQIWLTIDDLLVRLEGDTFVKIPIPLKDTSENVSSFRFAFDANNNLWLEAPGNLLFYDRYGWNHGKLNEKTIDSLSPMAQFKGSEEVLLCTQNGLYILKNGTWSKVSSSSVRFLKSSNVYYAKRDSKERLWVGSKTGSFIIDKNGNVEDLNQSSSLLKEKCITSLTEDEEGNVYLVVKDNTYKDCDEEREYYGLVKYSKDKVITSFTVKNSGIPSNVISRVLYDKNEKVLWIVSRYSGLIRFDLKFDWQVYHNWNSKIPTSALKDIAIDNSGDIYLSTFQGLVQIKRKQ